jgi:hypothetical protein
VIVCKAPAAAIPVIVLTGHDFKTGLYLMKPTSPERLARQIAALLAARPLSDGSLLGETTAG